MQDARSITGLPGNPVYTCPVGKNTLRAPALVCLRTPKLPSPTCFPDRGVPHEFDPHVPPPAPGAAGRRPLPCRRTDRKSTRLNSSHLVISYAVFCLKKKKTIRIEVDPTRQYR